MRTPDFSDDELTSGSDPTANPPDATSAAAASADPSASAPPPGVPPASRWSRILGRLRALVFLLVTTLALWRGRLGAAWRDVRGARRRSWPRAYWRALVSHAGQGPARRFAFVVLITTLILTGSGGLFLTDVLFPRLFGGSSVTHSPNTLDQFKQGGNAYGQTGSQTPTPHTPVPPSSGALSPAQASSSTAPTTLQPVDISLDPSRHLNNGSQSAGAVTRYLASDGVLEVGLSDTSIDLTSATPSGAPLPTYTPAPKPTPAPHPAAPSATPTAAPSAAAPSAAAPSAQQASSASSASSSSPRSSSSSSSASQASHVAASASAQLSALAPYATGPFSLELTPSQTAFYSGHNGAWLGVFTLRVLDGSRTELTGVKLAAPLTLRFHYQPGELAGLNTTDIRLVWTATGDQKANKTAQYVPVSADVPNTTLTASVSSLVGGPLALTASSTDAGTATSEHLTTAGNSGDAQFTVPLQIPPAAGGVAPNLQLTYGSGGPNGRHGSNASAPPTGDGWNLTLGSISYDQSNNMYYLNGIGGISEPLLCCMTDARGITFYVPHHHPSVRVQASGANPTTSGNCFTVWPGDGMAYQMGCTADSKRETAVGGVTYFVEWDVNLVTRVADNGGNNMLQQYALSYWQDNTVQPGTGLPITRDAALKEIDYNSVGGAPQARILFNIHWPGATNTSGPATATTYGNNYNCSTTPPVTTTLRCDDPIDQPGWSLAPLNYSTITLDRVTPQIYSSGAWQTTRTYDFSYQDLAFFTCWDGFAGTWMACAGEHLLTQVQETPYQNNTAMPSRQPLVFTYTPLTRNNYYDMTNPNWNGGNVFNDQDWWAYLATFTDQQTGAGGSITYKTAYSNTHGVPAGSNVLDPFACDAVNCWTGATNPPEDRQWPRQVVASITDTGISSGGTTITTTYAYTLKQTCGTGCTQDAWIPPNQYNTCGGIAQPPQSTMQSCLLGNYSNYWMQEYTGFETVTTTHPDSSTTWEQYYGGAGWGTNDWDIANMYRDRTLVSDVYQGSATGTPLQETRSTYLGYQCPVTNPSLGWQLFQTPYMLCFAHETQRDTYLGGSGNVVQNGGFNGPNGTGSVANWTASPNSNFTAYASGATGNNAYEGSGYAATNTTVTGGGFYQDIPATINPGDRYCATAEVATQGAGAGAGGSFTLWLLGGTNENGAQAFSNLPGGNSWTAVSACVTATAAHTAVRVQFYPTPNAPTLIADAVTASRVVPKSTQTWTYNQTPPEQDHFHDELLSTTTTTNDLSTDTYSSGTISGQPSFTTTYDYVYRDGWNETPQTYDYFLNLPAQTRTKDNASTPVYWRCSQTRYDGLGYGTGANSALKAGLPTQSDTFQACDSSGNGSSPLTTTQGYDTFGQPLVGLDADANAGDATHKACVVSGSDTLWLVAPSGASSFTGCTRYDGTYHAFPVGSANAKNQTTATTYDYVQGVPTSSTDANGQVTTFAGPIYEYNGSVSLANYQDLYSQQSLPGETYGGGSPWTTRAFSFSFCATASGNKPCIETDTVAQVDGANLKVTRQLYDRDGRLVETRVSGPAVGQDTVTITGYNDTASSKFTGQPCSVATLTTSNGGRTVNSTAGYIAPTQTATGSSAYVDPGVSGTNCFGVTGTTTYQDALGRTIAADDAIGTGAGTSGSGCLLPGGTMHHTSCTAITPVVASSVAGLPSSDTQPYLRTLSIDANLHQSATYTDALERMAYTQQFSGASQNPLGSGIASYAVTSATYEPTGAQHSVTDAAGAITSWTYNAAGRLTALSDPDRGSESYSYDANGNKLTAVDARGASGTIYAGYDALNRTVWRNSTNSPSGAYVAYSYDDTTGGNFGVGRLTNEQFSGALGSGSYTYTYDARGQTTHSTLTVGSTPYTVATAYTDFGAVATQTYPTGETVTTSYSAVGALLGVTRTLSGTTTTLIDNIAYTVANGLLASARLGNGKYTNSITYDGLLRPNDLKTIKIANGATLFEEQPTYDPLGNVSGVTTTLSAGSDVQKYCYDEQDRLTWAGSVGTPTCTGTAITPGSLTGAQYTQTFAYNQVNGLSSGPLGAYTYGDSAHKHAATSIGSSVYTAKYDASGNMTCRAPTSATTCAGTATGAQLGYDTEGRLTAWQNKPNNPGKTAQYLYDGEGRRVQQRTVSGGTTTTTTYVSDIEQIAAVSGGATTTTTYYQAMSKPIALAVDGALYYLASDTLSSVSVALDSTGAVKATQLFFPYGASRYHTGTMPTDKGFTGQRADVTTGLDYYNARYYDPTAGQFTSADTQRDGFNRYEYVQGNPTTHTDPSGHCWPLCTMIIGAVIGAAIGAGVSIATQAASGKPMDWSEVGKQAAVGAIAGAVSGLAGPEAGIAVHAAVGAAAGAIAQATSNVLEGKPLGDGVLEAAAIGGITGGVAKGAGGLLKRAGGAIKSALRGADEVAGAAEGGSGALEGASQCLLSFSPETPVATPHGAQAIGTLQVGDAVTAYDPATGKTSTQTVQHVWINHDDDLLDVTLRADAGPTDTPGQSKPQRVALVAHGAQAPPSASSDETIQTTEKHPWLTTDKGWRKAGELRLGEHVVRLDGGTATVVALHARTGEQADYYNLTVSDLHTYAVGAGQFVVHNCGGKVDYGSTDLSKVVVWARRTLPDLEHNFAAAELEDGSTILARSTPKGPGIRGTIHAEGDLLSQAESRGMKIVRLYSEREPCSTGAACGPNLLQHNPDMEITWSWDYNGLSAKAQSAIAQSIRTALRGLP